MDNNNILHHYGLARCSQNTGKIDTTLVGLGKGMIQLWALQNTTKTKICVVVDIDERKTIAEYIGTENGFPIILKEESEFTVNIPDELYDIFESEAHK